MSLLKKLLNFSIKRPRLALLLALMLSYAGYIAYDRVPKALGCTYDAVIDQGVPFDKWQFNWMAGKCQYYNGTRWIPLQKVMDVGAELELGE